MLGRDDEDPVPAWESGWWLSLYPAAAEAGGSFVYQYRPRRTWVPGAEPADRARSESESARRARTRVRRYCAANRLNRLGTLTYAGAGCHDPHELRADVARFFRGLRSALGGQPLPYVWVPEWHKTGHGQHVHFAVGRYVRKSVIAAAWDRGFVNIKLLSDLPVGSGTVDQARKAAGYRSKYISKAFDAPRVPGLHRFDVAQGFQPTRLRLHGRTSDEAIERAVEQMGGVVPAQIWRSDDAPQWQGPPAVWVSWQG